MNDGFNRFSGFCSLPPVIRSFERIIPCFLGKNRDKAFAKDRTWSKATIKTGSRDSINMGLLKKSIHVFARESRFAHTRQLMGEISR
jgi:hypothetical protein